MGPLRRIISHDEPEVPAHEPKRDVADAPGIPRETRLGRRVEEETCFITDQTVTQALQPSQLNGGNLVDIFQNREDDFEAVETMEVSYTSSSGEKVQELVFAENSKQTFSGPRILVSASRVNTMHRAISVLSRKVDNLTTTLRVCREHYYKELFSLRHGRQPSEEHEKFWFTPQAYQDTVSIQELRKRFGTEQEDLRKREQEVRELRAKLRQIDSIAEDRLEKLITRKTIPELFDWMREMNGFREVDFDLHLQVLAQEISLKATEENKAPDLEKEKLKSSLEDAEFQVESLQTKLREAQVANQGLMQLLTERRAEPIVAAPIEEEPDLDVFSNPSSVATPVRSKETAEMSQRRRSQATEDTLTVLNRQAQAAAELAEAEEKNRQLQSLADAWEKEAREQSRKNVQLERANKDSARLQKAKDQAEKGKEQAEKEAAKAHQQKEALQKQVEKYKSQIETLRADGFEVESVRMSEDGGLFSRRNTIEEEELVRDTSKGRLKPGKASKASSRAASKSSGKGSDSPKGSKTPRSPRRAKSKGKPEKEEEDPGPDPFQLLNDLDNTEEAQDPDEAVSLGSEAFLRGDGTLGGDSVLALPEGMGIGVSRDATMEMSSFEVSLGLLEDTDYTNLTTEGPKQLHDASVQTLITTDFHPPRWLVLQNENNTGDEWVSSQAALDHLIEYTKFKLLQWSVHFIKSEEPDVLKTAAALAALDHRMTGLGRSATPSGRPGRLSTAVQRIQRMQQGNWHKVVEMEEARKNQLALNQLPETKPMRQPPPLKASEKLKRLSSAARRWVASPSSPSSPDASISTSEPVGRMSLAASPPATPTPVATPRRDSRSLPPMHEVSSFSPEVSRLEGLILYHRKSPLPRMKEVEEPGDLDRELELRSSLEVEWPRHVSESLLSSGSEKAPSSRQSLSEEPRRDSSFKDLLQFEKETHFDHFGTRDVPKVAAAHDWTQGVPYALRPQEAKPGNGLFTTPAKPLKVNNKEKWMPKVSLGGFSNLDTPSLISGHLDRFQEEFEAARSSSD